MFPAKIKHKSMGVEAVNVWMMNAVKHWMNPSDRAQLNDDLAPLLGSSSSFWPQMHVHHLSPVIHELFKRQALDSSRYPILYRRVRRLRRMHIQRSLTLLHEMKRVCDALQNMGIPVAVYKGVPFALQFYGDVSKRTTRDIDLAIPYRHYGQTAEVMRGLDYVMAKQKGTAFGRRIRAKYLDYPWNKLGQDGQIIINVDIHWKPSHHALYSTLQFDDSVLDRRIILSEHGDIPSLGLMDHALSVIIHHGVVDGWAKYYQLIDLIKILDSMSDDQVRELMDHCKTFGCAHTLQMGIMLIQEMYGIHGITIETSMRQAAIAQYMDKILAGHLSGNWSNNSTKVIEFIRSRDRLSDKVRAISRLIHYQAASKFS